MSEAIPCLIRVGDNVKKNKIIRLDRDQVSIGRSSDVTYALPSEVISRRHAVLQKKEDGKWIIKDNKSRNGVLVNGSKLDSADERALEDGDMVQFGVPSLPTEPAEFIYKFHLKVRVKRANHKRLKEDPVTSANTTATTAGSQTESDGEERKRKQPVPSCSSRVEPGIKEDDSKAGNHSKEAEYLAKLEELKRLLDEKEKKQSEVEEQLERERQERLKKIQEVEELKVKEQMTLMDMQDKQAQLEKDKELLTQKIEADLEANQKVIETKDKEQKLLASQLDQTKKENETAKLQAMQTREEVVSNFVDLMEMELQCTICNELFIKATALNCAHVFCKLCINQWLAVKNECPICRVAVASQMQSFAMDSYIDKMVEQLNHELKEKRKTLLEQRKAEQEQMEEMRNAASRGKQLPAYASRGARGGRGRVRGGSRGRGRNARGASATITRGQFSAASATATSQSPSVMASTSLRSGVTVAVPIIASRSNQFTGLRVVGSSATAVASPRPATTASTSAVRTSTGGSGVSLSVSNTASRLVQMLRSVRPVTTPSAVRPNASTTVTTAIPPIQTSSTVTPAVSVTEATPAVTFSPPSASDDPTIVSSSSDLSEDDDDYDIANDRRYRYDSRYRRYFRRHIWETESELESDEDDDF